MPHVTTDWDRVATLFADALDRPPDERTAWLRAACGDDPPLYAEVAALLTADDAAHPLLDGRAADVLSGDAFEDALAPSLEGEMVGPWALRERIGTGGMGAVYRAERAGDFDQVAALKRIKPGMDSEAVLARFRAERQILARLQHPGIAGLLDGGRTAEGRPYFAMEYVRGEPITAFADRQRLGVRGRVALFAQACEAVAYAHRRLVVHRDLKPSNVLVAEGDDGEPAVKLLDFGIARMLQGDGDEAVLTQTGQLVLTPAYAAPEQVQRGEITTATDVYALGVVLYELLVGARPYTVETRSPAEIERVVTTAEPFRPSAVVGGDDAGAALRSTSPRRLAVRLAGDLDAITLMALRKEPERRYGSAAELLADVRRHLDGLPVIARGDSLGYRVGTFVRRHRVGLAATTASLAAGALVAALAFARVSAERDRAQREAATAEGVSAFLAGLFSGATPRETGGAEVSARDLLDTGADRVTADLRDQPVARARMLHVIGTAYMDLGVFDEAEARLSEAMALRRRHLGDRHPDVASTLDALGLLYERQGRYHDAAATNRDAVALHRLYADERPLALANSLHGLSFAQLRLGHLGEAEALIREALTLKRATLGDHHADVAYSLNILGDVLNQRGDPAAGVAVHQEALAMRRDLLGDDHLDLAFSLHNLAAAYRDLGQWADAEPRYREALRIWQLHFGEGDQENANTISQLALAVGMQGRSAEAEGLHDEALALARRVLEDDHPKVAAMLMRRGRVLAHKGRPSEAEGLYREALALRRRTLGDRHPSVAEWTARLGTVLAVQGRRAEAERALGEAARLCDAASSRAECAAAVRDAEVAVASESPRAL